jgi:peptidoglycan/LPS O-acetylase OafA/YrhL
MMKPSAALKALAATTTPTSKRPSADRMPTTHPVLPRRLPGLDGLRAIAVAAVVLYHVAPGTLPGGGLGVDMFFVISGFLITGLLFTEHVDTGRIRFRSFWARRARRLLPALVVLVVVCCTVALFLGGDVLVGIGRQVLGAATFSSNWLGIASGTSYFAQSTPELFRNLWSLAVEEQYYLVWPFIVLLAIALRRTWIRAVLFAAIAVASATAMAVLYSPHVDSTRVYYGTDTHSFGLALGAALAILTSGMSGTPLEWPKWSRRLLPIPGAIAVVGLIALALVTPAESALTIRGGLATVAVLTGVAIWGSIIPGSLLGRALDAAPIRWIGVRSYGIYLWHWPVLVLITAAEPRWQDAPVTLWLTGILTVAITLAAATLSYRYLERPIRREGFRAWISSRFTAGTRRGLRIAATCVAAFLLASTLGATAVAVIREPLHGQAQSNIDAGRAALIRARFLPPPPRGAAGTRMDAIGDSVMMAASPELQQSFPGISIDAVVSRQMNRLPGIVEKLDAEHELRQTLVVGLGTNGYIAASTLEEVHNILGPSRQMILVNAQVPRTWQASVNGILSEFADEYDNVELADWHQAIAPHISILAPDHIHPGPTGGRIYASTITAALARLATQPPYPTLADFVGNRASANPAG